MHTPLPSPGSNGRIFIVATLILISVASVSAAPEPGVTLDELFAQVGQRVPAFGGLYLEDGRLEVRFVGFDRLDPGERTQARAALAETIIDVFGRTIEQRVRNMRIVDATYGMPELLAWYSEVIALASDKSVMYTDVNERENVLTIGVVEGADTRSLEGDLAFHRIPLDAVRFRTAIPTVKISDVTDRIRPVVGGLQIQRVLFQVCTLGINVEFEQERRGFITNSHCTRLEAFLEGSTFRQPTIGLFGNNVIGDEVVDPRYMSNGPGCPPGAFCRHSDSALVEYRSGATSSLGKIARIGNWGWGPISNSDPDYDVVTLPLFILSGEPLMKVGRTTGKTGAVVSETCRMTDEGHDRFLLCQYSVEHDSSIGGGVEPFADHGDSGSPVFRLLPGSNHPVAIYGILHSATEDFESFTFSPIHGVIRDLDVDDLRFR